MGKYKIKISEDRLKYLYLKKKLSSRKIAEELNCNKATILERLHRYNIPLREAKKIRIEIPKNVLEKLYLNEKLSSHKIAERFSVSPVLVYERLHEYNIPTRSISEALKGRIPWNKGGHLSEKTKRKLSKIWKKFWKNPKFIEKMIARNKILSERMKGERNPMRNPKSKKKRSEKMKGKLAGDKNPAKKLKVRREISRTLKGHIVSPKVRKKIARSLIGRYVGELNPFYGKHHTEEVKEKTRMRAIKQLISGAFKNRITSIELKIEKELRKRNIYYKKQFPLLSRTIVDFYLPQYRVVIYCDGTFWHKSKWAEKEGVIEKDRKQTKFLFSKGYKVFRFSETEIENSARNCVDRVLRYINKI